MAGTTRTGSIRPTSPAAVTGPPRPGDSSAATPEPSTTRYSATSTTVRLSPAVNGTLSGHGGSRIVLGRNQYRKPPNGGQNRAVSGPDPQPRPRISNSSVKTTSFWYTMGCVHQSAMRPSPPRPGVSEITAAAPAT